MNSQQGTFRSEFPAGRARRSYLLVLIFGPKGTTSGTNDLRRLAGSGWRGKVPGRRDCSRWRRAAGDNAEHDACGFRLSGGATD